MAHNCALVFSNSGDMGQATLTSQWVKLDAFIGYAIQVDWSGGTGTTGTLTLEASNDEGGSVGQDPANITHTTTVAGSSTSVTTDSGDEMWHHPNVFFRWVRVKWTKTAGSGATLVGRFNARGQA